MNPGGKGEFEGVEGFVFDAEKFQESIQQRLAEDARASNVKASRPGWWRSLWSKHKEAVAPKAETKPKLPWALIFGALGALGTVVAALGLYLSVQSMNIANESLKHTVTNDAKNQERPALQAFRGSTGSIRVHASQLRESLGPKMAQWDELAAPGDGQAGTSQQIYDECTEQLEPSIEKLEQDAGDLAQELQKNKIDVPGQTTSKLSQAADDLDQLLRNLKALGEEALPLGQAASGTPADRATVERCIAQAGVIQTAIDKLGLELDKADAALAY